MNQSTFSYNQRPSLQETASHVCLLFNRYLVRTNPGSSRSWRINQISDQDRTPGNREFKACKQPFGLVERIVVAIDFPCDLVLADF